MACVSTRSTCSTAAARSPGRLRVLGLPSKPLGIVGSNSRTLWRARASNKWEERFERDVLAEGCPVPVEQQPIQELRALQETLLFDWATMPLPQFAQKLAIMWAGFMLTLGLPVSAVTFNLAKEPAQCLVSASIGSMFIVTVLVWRLYLGWQHVGSRLLSATVEYEETGWYDGQVWVKTPQVLMRDRLQNSYTVRPALTRLKRTLLGLGGSLALSVVLLATLTPADAAANGSGLTWAEYQRQRQPQPQAQAAAVAAAAAGAGGGDGGGDTYWERVERFEPWAAQEGGSGERPPLQAHMYAGLDG